MQKPRSKQCMKSHRACGFACVACAIMCLPSSGFADELTKSSERATQPKTSASTSLKIRSQENAIPTRINVRDAVDLQIEGALFLDVREPEEFNTWHVPGSTLIPVGELMQRMAEISADKGRVITIICHSGVRSATAQALLQEAGFSRAASIEGGIVAWDKEGLPVMKSENFNP